jgi:hypothetical protein
MLVSATSMMLVSESNTTSVVLPSDRMLPVLGHLILNRDDKLSRQWARLGSLGSWLALWLRVMGMIDKAGHIAGAADAVAVFQKHCGTGDEHAIADLICDLGHLADERGFDFLSEVKRGIGHWYAEHHASDRDYLGPDAAVEITITPR